MTAGTDDRDLARVRGGLGYTADVPAPGALHVAFVASAVPHARILGIDTSAAWELPGVVDVVTAADIGEIMIGRSVQDYPVLAGERVRFVGQRIAAVAAEDRATARAAAAQIEVDYEDLPPVPTLAEAEAAGEDVVHPGYADYLGARADRPGPNTQGVWAMAVGEDVPAALAAADHVVETEYVLRRNHAAPIEPHACVASVGDRGIDLWSATKEPHNTARFVATALGVPLTDVRVHMVPVGGDFGAKGYPFAEVLCCLVSRRTGRPVRHTMSYYEVLVGTSTRHETVMRLRTGVRDGKLVAVDADTRFDGGAYAGVKPVPMAIIPTLDIPFASYSLENRDERCVSYYTTTQPGGHVRAPGEYQGVFAGESQMDEIAAELGRDPIEFRLANAVDGRVHRILAEIEPIARRWRAEAGPDTGIGVAMTFRNTGPGQSTVRGVATPEGLEIQHTVADQGSGSHAVFRLLAGEAIGVPADSVRMVPVPTGTDEPLFDLGAGASRVTAVAGQAVIEAAKAVAEELGGAPGGPVENWIPKRLAERGLERVTALGSAKAGWPAPPELDVRSHCGMLVEVRVDRETGELDLRRVLLVVDTGRVLNPRTHRGQIEGGFIYGLSQALLEELVLDEGAVSTATLGDYRIASAGDMPPLEVRVLEPYPGTEDTILGVGELTNTCVAPAIANAVADAVGVRIREVPITAERVLDGLLRTGEPTKLAK